MKDSTFIKRVILKNYKSIAACDVQLQPLTFLVGRNGSGKSNFLDALRFVADALNTSLDHAIRDRGGHNGIRRQARRRPKYLSIGLNFVLPDGFSGYYYLRINFLPAKYFEVQNEVCIIQNKQSCIADAYYRVENGIVKDASVEVAPAVTTDRLYLVNASGLPEFRPVYDAFSRMGFYNINPAYIRDIQIPDSGNMLNRNGSNITSVLANLPQSVKTHVEEYLTLVTPGIHEVQVKSLRNREIIVFLQKVADGDYVWRYYANDMSDGTLRALGILVALFQENLDVENHIKLVGIEEPELALHPAAAGVLLDALRDAACKTQVIITSHSPDLLDNKDLDIDSILAVEAHDGTTAIAPIDEASRSVIRDRLFTTGELLRLDQLQPDPISVEAAAKTKQLTFTEILKNENIRIDKKNRRTDDL
ncbi:MAG: AAA family ATPase [Candidatus Poribacteria bacterium]|nr:AAA family ATPase [Candidatus Poribacteria bacterium]